MLNEERKPAYLNYEDSLEMPRSIKCICCQRVPYNINKCVDCGTIICKGCQTASCLNCKKALILVPYIPDDSLKLEHSCGALFNKLKIRAGGTPLHDFKHAPRSFNLPDLLNHLKDECVCTKYCFDCNNLK